MTFLIELYVIRGPLHHLQLMKKYDFAKYLGMELRWEVQNVSFHMKIQLSERILTENVEKLDFQAENEMQNLFSCKLLFTL